MDDMNEPIYRQLRAEYLARYHSDFRAHIHPGFDIYVTFLVNILV